jgi:hypothetical protein
MSDEIAEEAYRFLRAHLSGRIRFDGERVEIRVAPTPDGNLVAPVMVAMLRAVDVAIELPDDSDESLVLQVTLEQITEEGPDGALCDRWCFYHGRWMPRASRATSSTGRRWCGRTRSPRRSPRSARS